MVSTLYRVFRIGDKDNGGDMDSQGVCSTNNRSNK
jgi:hypothetical protein